MITAEELLAPVKITSQAKGRLHIVGDDMSGPSVVRRRVSNRVWRRKNREKAIASTKAWAMANPDKIKANHSRWLAKHRARVREINRQSARKYREKHRDRINARRRELAAARRAK